MSPLASGIGSVCEQPGRGGCTLNGRESRNMYKPGCISLASERDEALRQALERYTRDTSSRTQARYKERTARQVPFSRLTHQKEATAGSLKHARHEPAETKLGNVSTCKDATAAAQHPVQQQPSAAARVQCTCSVAPAHPSPQAASVRSLQALLESPLYSCPHSPPASPSWHNSPPALTAPKSSEPIGTQAMEDERQFLEQTARLCDGRFSAQSREPATAELCTKLSDGRMPSQHVWAAKDAGHISSTSVLPSRSGAASPQPSCSPPRRPANTPFINFNLDLTSSAPFSMSPTHPEALSTLQGSRRQTTGAFNATTSSSRPASCRSHLSIDDTQRIDSKVKQWKLSQQEATRTARQFGCSPRGRSCAAPGPLQRTASHARTRVAQGSLRPESSIANKSIASISLADVASTNAAQEAAESSERISRKPRPQVWSITPPRRCRSSTATRNRSKPRAAFGAHFQAPKAWSAHASNAPATSRNPRASSTNPTGTESKNVSDTAISGSFEVNTIAASHPESAGTAPETQKRGAADAQATLASPGSSLSFRARQRTAWSPGPMSRSQAWPGSELGMTAAERQQQLEDLRAESCAPSPLTPASLWEINKAKQFLASLRLGVTDLECTANSLLDNPLFNGCLLHDLASVWKQATAPTAASSRACSSPPANKNTRGASADIAAPRTARHRGFKACHSVAMARELTVDALQQLGLIRGAPRGPAAGPGNRTIECRAEQDEALVSSMLQGNSSAVWGVIAQVMRSWQRAQSGQLLDMSKLTVAVQPSWRRVRLQGSEAAVLGREKSALEWLRRVGAFPCERPASFCMAVGRLSDGTHLARLAGKLLGPIAGILHRPCTNDTRRSNMQKIVDALKTLGPIKWRAAESLLQAACRGEHAAMLVFVEAIQKVWMHERGPQDPAERTSAPPQTNRAPLTDAEVTCLPSAMHAAGACSSAGSLESSGWAIGTCTKGGRPSTVPNTAGSAGRQAGLSRPVSTCRGALRTSSNAPKGGVRSAGHLSASGEATSQRGSPCCPLSSQSALASGCSQATAAAEATFGKTTPGIKQLRDKGKRPNSAGASSRPKSASPHGARARSRDSAASTSLHRDGSDRRGFGGPPAGDCKAEGASPRSMRRMRSMSAPGTTRTVSMMLKGSEPDEEALRAWLAHKGVKIDQDVALEEICRDGSMLAYITQLLTKQRLSGINMKPSSQAAALHNVRKVLLALRQNKDMPLEGLWGEEDIVAGARGAALQLMWNMCCVYSKQR